VNILTAELMLKPHYEPYRVRKQWPEIMMAFTRIPYTEECRPRIEYRTHAFLTKYVEKSVTDPCAIRLLYDEVCMLAWMATSLRPAIAPFSLAVSETSHSHWLLGGHDGHHCTLRAQAGTCVPTNGAQTSEKAQQIHNMAKGVSQKVKSACCGRCGVSKKALDTQQSGHNIAPMQIQKRG
jgi:hypothetical protein